MRVFYHVGRYFQFMLGVFQKPEKHTVLFSRIVDEINKIGIGSLGIISIISVFMGAVIVMQTASNIDSPLLPLFTVGFTARQSIILEFSPTIMALILAGKVGSNIASELGTMRVTEQIDALEIMGINSKGFLVLPKVFAAMFINPFLIIISMFVGLAGGYLIGAATGLCPPYEYVYGIRYDFKLFSVIYALVKTVVFAFVIASVSAYHGYYTKGGALEVGTSSTNAVVYCSIIILVLNYALTQLLLI